MKITVISYEDHRLLGCGAVLFGRNLSKVWRNIVPPSSCWEHKPCGNTVQYVWLDRTVRGCGGVSRRWCAKNCGGGGWLWQSKNRSQVTCSWSGAGGWREKTEKGEPDGARLEGEGERWENIPSHGGRRKNELQDRGRIKRETAELRYLPTLESINCVF